jgi:hypothetical protein
MIGFENRWRYAAEGVACGRSARNKNGGETEAGQPSNLTQNSWTACTKGCGPSLDIPETEPILIVPMIEARTLSGERSQISAREAPKAPLWAVRCQRKAA